MKNLENRNLESIVNAYLACAAWTDLDEDGEPINDKVGPGDASSDTRKQAVEDCTQFLSLCDEDGVDLKDWSDEQLGHDFWLTRNGHGTGFWDRGWEAGDKASDWARTFSDCHAYVEDTDTRYVLYIE